MSDNDHLGNQTLSVSSFRRVFELCVRFEEEYRGGGSPRIEDYLKEASDPIRSSLSRELVALEIELGQRFPEASGVVDHPTRVPDPNHASTFRDEEYPGPVVAIGATSGGAVAASPKPREQPTVPGYAILGELGRGAMGVVYQARQVRLNRLCALKMILAGDHAGPEAVLRFLTEAETVARLQHPGIVQIYGIGDYNGHPYLELEYLAGGNLAQKLDGTPRPAREAARLIQSIAQAVGEAHRSGVVHRDLKPGNILMTADGRPKVADFGLAKSLKSGGDLTGTDSVMGSPSYMAPEQAEGRTRDVGPQADLYSLGAIYYELLTGRPPFRASSILLTLEQVCTAEPVPPSRLQPGLARDAETICLTCLEKDPSRRYASAEALAEDLRRFLAREPIRARRTGSIELAWRWCVRRPAVAGLLAALLMAVSVGFTVVVAFWRKAETQHELAVQKSREAVQEKRNALAEASRIALERGVQACEQGEIGRGIVWMARSLALAPADEAELRWGIRAKLAHWRLGLVRLEKVLPHEHEVNVARFSPDGQQILTGEGLYYSGKPHVARLWQVSTGTQIGQPLKHGGAVMDVAFSPDGRRFYTCSMDRLIRTWDAGPLAMVGSTYRSSTDMSISPDGRQLVYSTDGGAQVVDLASGQPVGPFLAHPEILDVEWGADGRLIATAGKDGAVRLWDPSTGKLTQPPHSHGHWVYSASISPDGKRILSSSVDRTSHLWDAATGSMIRSTSRHRGGVGSTGFGPDGRLCATASGDGGVHITEVDSGRGVGQPLPHGSAVESVEFGRDGRSLLTAGADKMARVWALPPGYSWAKSLPHAHMVRSVAISPDGSTILMGSQDGTARREKLADGRLAGSDSWAGKPISRVLYRPDGRVFLTVAEDSARLWDAETGRPLSGSVPIHHPRPGLIKGLLCAAFSPDGKRVFTGGSDQFVRTWDASTGRFLGELLRANDGVNALAVDPEGKRIVTGDWTGHLHVWDAETGRPIGGVVQHGSQITELVFHPGRAWFLSASTDGTAQLWDWRDLQRVGPALMHRASLDRIAISRDGRMIATSAPREGDDPAGAGAQLWDTLTGTPLGPPIRHQGQVVELAFSPPGDALLTVGNDGFVRTWRLPSLPADAPERLMDWARVVTGLAMDGRGVVRLMEAGERDRASAALIRAGGSPFADEEEVDEPGRQLKLAIDAIERGQTFARDWHLARSPIGATVAGPPNPTLAPATMRCGDLLSGLGDWSGALKTYREVARLRPEDPVTAIHLGVACMKTGAIDEGIAAFRRAITLHPGYARAYLNTGIALEAGKKTWSLPLPLLATVVAPQDPGLALALMGLSWGDVPAVSRLYVIPLESAAHNFPNSALLQTRLGIGRLHAGDFDRAIDSLRGAIRLDPNSSTAYQMMGTALIERTNRLLDPVVDRKAEAEAYYRLGKFVFEERKFPQALGFFRKAEQLDPAGSSPALARIASILEGRGEYGAALEALEKSLRLDPSIAETWNDRAWLLATCADPKFRDGPRAVEDALHAAELSGWKDPSILDSLAAAHAEVGDFREAVRWQERALSLQKLGEFEDRLALYRKGVAYHRDGGIARR